jgi:mannan endo-1,4-beta-mannosidase
MKKEFTKYYFIFFLFIFCNDLFAQRNTMYVNGRYLYSAASEKVILRGINEMYYALDDKSGKVETSEIAKTGANTVRISWQVSKNTTSDINDLDNAINNCIQNKMIPIVTLIEATGIFENLQLCLDFWKRNDVVNIINKHKKWFILNIANEAGFIVSDDVYKLKYKDAISQLRGKGIQVPLLIDGAGFGQDVEQIIRCASEIINADNDKNIFFSCHTYWNTNHENRLNAAISAILSANLPVIFGEAPVPTSYNEGTAQSPNCKFSPYKYFLQKFNENEFGWMAWSWGKVQNNDCRPPNGRSLYDITSDGKYGNWLPNNPWAVDVTISSPYSIKNTSIIPPSFNGAVGTGGSKAEAENGSNIGVANANSFGGFSGSGYVDGTTFVDAGDVVKVFLNVSGGSYTLNIRYNGRYGEKNQDVFVNGNSIGTIQFPASTTWVTKAIPNVNLSAGNNTIEIKRNWGWMDIDYVEAAGASVAGTSIILEAEAGTLVGVASANNIAGYSGNGFVDGTTLDAEGDLIKVFPQVNSQGSYTLNIRYNGRFGEKYQNIYINNVFYSSVQFPANNGWATKLVGIVNLNAGNNIIELRRNWGWMDVDYFTITKNTNSPIQNTLVSNTAIAKLSAANNFIVNATNSNKIFIDASKQLEANENAFVRLLDTDGKLLQQWLINKNQKEFTPNKTLGLGVYIIQIVSKMGNFSKKLIIQ